MPRHTIRIAYGAMVILALTVTSGCAARQVDIGDIALSAGELALQIDVAEQVAFDEGVIGGVLHNRLGTVILQLLYAARGFERAVAAGADARLYREELSRVLVDLAQASVGVPSLSSAIVTFQRFLVEGGS